MNRIFTKQHFLAGLMVGSFDITAACIQYFINTGRGPDGVLMYIASGVFGKQAFEGGMVVLLSGLTFHFLIAISFSFLFFTLVSRFPELVKHKIFLIVIYGIFMWAVVRFAIMPFSRINPPPLKLKNVATAVLILMLCISFPLSLVAERELQRRRTGN